MDSGSGGYRKKLVDDTPASPSPPHSPPPGLNSGAPVTKPIIIPTEWRLSSRRGAESPPLRLSRFTMRTPTPPPLTEKLKTVPIARVDVNEMGRQEWDTDDEDTSAPPQTRPEIIIPTMDVISAAKQVGDKFARKEEFKHGLC